jgi:hypothetical protein
MRYDDFTLLARPVKVGKTRLGFELQLPGVLDVALPCVLNTAVLGKRVAQACGDQTTWDAAFALGQLLADALLPPPVWQALNQRITQAQAQGQARGVRLRLLLRGPELNAWPWEFMLFNRGGGEPKVTDFLALMPQVSITRHAASPLPAWPVAVGGTVCVAALAASPGGDWPALAVDEELARIAKGLGAQPRIALRCVAHARPESLPDAALPAHVFHFAGHGIYETWPSAVPGIDTGLGSLILEDAHGNPEPVTADTLALKLRAAGVRVALLSACDTARRDDANAWSSVAETLLKAELGAVIGMQLPLVDASGLLFCEHFYRSLGLGAGIDDAVAAGRVAMAAGGDSRGWATPVLHLRSHDGDIFGEFAADAALEGPRAQARTEIETLRGRATNLRVGAMDRGVADAALRIDHVATGGRATNVEMGDRMTGGTIAATTTAGQVDGDLVNVSIGMLGAESAPAPAPPVAAPVQQAGAPARGGAASASTYDTTSAHTLPRDTDATTRLLEARTRDFVGRQWVFDAIDDWLADAQGGSVFLLTGRPGTGKSAVAARLVQMHQGRVAALGRAGPLDNLRPGFLAHHHFCQAGVEETLVPLRFVQALAQALANRYPACRHALESAGSQQFHIHSNITTQGQVSAGAHVTGAMVRIEILSGDARPLFDSMVRQPLQALARAHPGEPVIVLVDSLDEALSFGTDHNIAQLLRLVKDFPPQVRFIFTARSQEPRVTDLVGPSSLDLLANAPAGLDEVRLYALARLAMLPKAARANAAALVAQRSGGNFLYAYHVLNDRLRPGIDPDQVAWDQLPDRLESAYREFLQREIGVGTRWQQQFMPLLGTIAVGRGDGLTRAQLIGITGLAEDKAAPILSTCDQYLEHGGGDGGLYRIYHQSFRDFLLTDEQYGVFPADRHAAIAQRLQDQHGASWATCTDDYALRHTPGHWAEAVEHSPHQREQRTRSLVELTAKPKYQQRFEQRLLDLPALNDHMRRAVHAAALNGRADMLPWILRAALRSVTFRDEHLRAEAVLRPADEGRLDQAEARLRLFGELGEDWQVAGRLILAWLVGAHDPAAAERLHVQLAPVAQRAGGTLQRLAQRTAAALRGDAAFAAQAPPPVGLDMAQELVKRISGQAFDRELLQAINPSMLSTRVGPELQAEAVRGYVAAQDASMLIGAAIAQPLEGSDAFDRYVDAHAGYNYVVYRNRSLWLVLDAVLAHHPDQAWVRQRLRRILAAALSGGAVEHRDLLPLTAETLREAARGHAPSGLLQGWIATAVQAVKRLQDRRGADDAWGVHRRRLAGLMELQAIVLHQRSAAEAMLERIMALPGGFAGFQAPAWLRLADALRASRLDHPALLDDIMGRALGAAHHIQDYHFCARITARCNALARWHATPLSGTTLGAALSELARAPGLPRFQADHRVHEPYATRDPDDRELLSIAPARAAATLEQMVEVFQRPAVDFLRLNPGRGLAEPLDDGDPVVVPDPGLAPMLAVHLAARALADDALADDRAPLIRALVPVAAVDAVALDTLLSYLLLAIEPDDTGLMDDIVKVAGPVHMLDQGVPLAPIGPDGVMPD